MEMKWMIILVSLIALVGCEPIEIDTEPEQPTGPTPVDTFTIANWNLQAFGPTKASNPGIMEFYEKKLDPFDIIFVQEVRDATGEAFADLCGRFEGYECRLSGREGRTSSKEQIGVIYRSEYTLLNMQDLEDPSDVWERSPTMLEFDVDGYEFTVYNAHLKPTDVEAELNALEEVVRTYGNVMIIGDLNADCDYFDPEDEYAFSGWYWLIGDERDTTSTATDCAYDRIIVNEEMFNHTVSRGVYSTGISEGYSDHYIVYAEIAI